MAHFVFLHGTKEASPRTQEPMIGGVTTSATPNFGASQQPCPEPPVASYTEVWQEEPQEQ